MDTFCSVSNFPPLLNRLISKDGITLWGGGKTLLKNILFRIALPTLLFSFINFIPKMILRGNQLGMDGFLHDTVYGGSLWFTSALTISELILWLLLSTRIKNIYLYVIPTLGLFILATVMIVYNINLMEGDNIPWYYKHAMKGSLFLVLGGIYWRLEDVLNKIKPIVKYLVVLFQLFIYTCGVFLFTDWMVSDSLNNSTRLCGRSIELIIAIIGVLIIIEVCKKMPTNKNIEYFGRHTLGLYFLSGGIPNVLAIIAQKMGVVSSLYTSLIVAFIAFVISAITVKILNRWLPFLFDLRLIARNNK